MRKLIASILTNQAKRLLRHARPKIIVVAGSVGKTTTTQAVTTVLSESFKVRGTQGNYNTDLGVTCSLFNRAMPELLFNPLAWIWVMLRNELTILAERKRATFELAVLELGSDQIGELNQFEWLHPDIAVLTAIAPEHMDAFGSIEEVAKEETSVLRYANKAVVNKHMVDSKYLRGLDIPIIEYSVEKLKESVKPTSLHVYGNHSLQAVAAAVDVARELGMETKAIERGAQKVRPQAGRMNILEGVNSSKIIDDTYNASPEAVRAALDYLLKQRASAKVVLLGNMNELGDSSRDEHIAIGELCKPEDLDLVVTLGKDANAYTATAARAHGCRVIECESPFQAGNQIKAFLLNSEEGALVLCKGSQNGVFAEEAVKILLHNPLDSKKLVRQSNFWLTKKAKTFAAV